MANVYVYSGAAGAGTGADWANAYTTLAAAVSAKAAGDDFWVAHDHAETTTASINLFVPGTLTNPCRVMCVNRAGSVPPVSADLRTTATITATTTGDVNIGQANSAVYFYGINFGCGSAGSSTRINMTVGGSLLSFEACGLALNSTGSGQRISFGGTGTSNTRINLKNCTFTFSNPSQGFTASAGSTVVYIKGGTTAGSAPVTLFQVLPSLLSVEGMDLSAIASGNTLFGWPGTSPGGIVTCKDCKLGSPVTVAAAPALVGQRIHLIRCDSADTTYRHEAYDYSGSHKVETTIIRTGGASDGTTPISWKITTNANSKRHVPFEAMPISVWNETVGSPITLTVQGIWGGGAVPTDANIWMDVEYLGTSGFPLGLFASSGPTDQLAAGTNLAAGSGTWGGSTTKFALSKQITPQEKGPITVYIKAALASSTFYIDPLVTIS